MIQQLGKKTVNLQILFLETYIKNPTSQTVAFIEKINSFITHQRKKWVNIANSVYILAQAIRQTQQRKNETDIF